MFLSYSADYITSTLIRKLIQGLGFTDKIYQINYLLRINYFNVSFEVKSLINKIYQREVILLNAFAYSFFHELSRGQSFFLPLCLTPRGICHLFYLNKQY